MSICHISATASVSRSAGRSSTAAAAYRAGVCITDERTGEVFDYSRKRGVLSSDLLMPGDSIPDRAKFWNDVEKHHKRGDAMVAREVIVALPAKLSPAERKRLAHDFAKELIKTYGIAIDVSMHRPDKKGDQRNWHAHLLMSACHVELDGSLGKKSAELDPIHCKRNGVENLAERFRERWADLVNERLQENGIDERIDHRTLAAQGIDREPQQHLGPVITGLIRRGYSSYVKDQLDAEVAERLSQAKQDGDLVREKEALEQSIISLSTDIAAAKQEMELAAEAAKREMELAARPARIEDMVANWTARADAKLAEQKQQAAAAEQEREARQRAAAQQEQKTMEEKRRVWIEEQLKVQPAKPQPDRPRPAIKPSKGIEGPGF